jgi:basic membrane protein A and related proteins
VKKSLIVTAATAGALALGLAGCAEPPDTASGGQNTAAPEVSQASSDFKACMVSDAGGFDDKSFNETSHKGMTDAADELGIETEQVESHAAADYPTNIQAMVDANCSIIVTVGFLLADDTVAAAKANPDIDFAIVDENNETFAGVKNLKPLVFNTAESSFLAGYLAAAMSETGKVGTLGGAKIPTVTIFMDGFAQGVQHYNSENDGDVQVLGWSPESQDGQFVPGDDPFGNDAGGKQIAQNLISQGADVILPVAGPAGLGALQAAQASGGNVNAIWVDSDGCESAANYCDILISSVYKGMDSAVKKAIVDSHAGEMSNEPYVGTLENEGTGLAPYHEFEDDIPAEVKTKIEELKADIISGALTITSEAQPTG